MKTVGLDEIQDIVVVGAGPAALCTLHAARQANLRAVAIDKGPVCGALVAHPTYMRWFSTSDKLELAGFPLLTNDTRPTRREYLQYCRAFITYFGLDVVTYREVTAVAQADDLFTVQARDMFGREYAWEARNAVVATGFYDSPRLLDVPGEDLPKVTHRYSEAHYYAGHDVLVIGAGSSAAEVALELWRRGAHVTVAMRSERFDTKYWIEPDIENRIAEGAITAYRNARVIEIRRDDAVLEDVRGHHFTVSCDFVLAMTGYRPDTSLIERAGATVDSQSGKPVLSDKFETTVPGLYVAGTLIAGVESNSVFIENSRNHGPTIVRDILSKQTVRA
ncbi:MAG: YpdA family putative bacillithiol disulfide reductase [Candidatus Hydrogenedentes bacterium]|nr:YpdA family putative bacillithiol disulfide reductase [Candidatus Hydrogenedentota bacterium]